MAGDAAAQGLAAGLESAGVPIYLERDNVGRRMLEHFTVYNTYRLKDDLGYNRQMRSAKAKTVTALARLGAAGVPHVSILVDPTLGGVTASYAGVGDLIIAEQGALVGFAGPRVIEQITKQKLPPDAQRADFLLEHGMVDLVVHRRDLRATLSKLLRLYAGVRRLSGVCAETAG